MDKVSDPDGDGASEEHEQAPAHRTGARLRLGNLYLLRRFSSGLLGLLSDLLRVLRNLVPLTVSELLGEDRAVRLRNVNDVIARRTSQYSTLDTSLIAHQPVQVVHAKVVYTVA